MTARTIRTEASRVEGAAEFRLVLWVSRQVAQFVYAVCKLTLVTIIAAAALLKRPAQFRLVATGVGLLVRTSRLLCRLTDAAAEFAVIAFPVQEDVVDAERDTDSHVQALVLMLWLQQRMRRRWQGPGRAAGHMLAKGKSGVLALERRPEQWFRRLGLESRGRGLRMGHRMRNMSDERREEEHH